MRYPACLRVAFWLLVSALPPPAVQADSTPSPERYAQAQTRAIATYFPGRMAGSSTELLAAEQLQQQFRALGYQSDLSAFNTRYRYGTPGDKVDWRRITASSTIAAKAGQAGKGKILVIAHLDTYLPRSDRDLNLILGGVTLQGVDDSAAGLGIMLALARELGQLPLQVGVRFVALSAGVPDLAGSQDYLDRMSPREKQQTRLVVNLQQLIAGEKLRVDYQLPAGTSALSAQINALCAQARRAGIPLLLSKGLRDRPACPSLLLPFARAGLPVLEMTSGVAGDSCLERKVSAHFPQGTVRYQSQRDNVLWLDRHLHGQLARRTRLILLRPLLRDLTGAAQTKAAANRDRVGRQA
ncbi:Alkaline phosphatase isozyme conversion protein precursor [Candidatus Sodalis pierantonius str. SOPE]|uniref:Alkaline phosphatase isozyme conversion protein n=1 Tax=Candidatus Sodalis pierantonii str. SOPE TaxID=2342 RepID=W0HMG0_9GAMM|nr:M28 family peptidase [Candidatus Sodalis pierantonius]AHF73380.1 Alkaline phosphatase isozyme conversion protein precursor [Candidatus Sodalis pierantonius str. SOPE]